MTESSLKMWNSFCFFVHASNPYAQTCKSNNSVHFFMDKKTSPPISNIQGWTTKRISHQVQSCMSQLSLLLSKECGSLPGWCCLYTGCCRCSNVTNIFSCIKKARIAIFLFCLLQ